MNKNILIIILILVILLSILFYKFIKKDTSNIILLNQLCTLDNYNNLSIKNLKKFMLDKNTYSLCDKNVFKFVKNNCIGNGVIIGVWKGGLAMWAKANMDKKSKLYLFDTFQNGFKKENKFNEYYFPSIDSVKDNFKKFNIDTNNIYWYEGDVKNTIYELKDKNLKFIYIDVDLYEPTLNSLVGTYHLLETDGICGIDDYNVEFFDCKNAVETFWKWHGIKKYNKINEYAIYWKKEKNKFKSNNENLIYNFFCVYNESKVASSLSSSSIFEMICNYYQLDKKLIRFTQELQNNIGINNTIWGIKKEKNSKNIGLEYYYYGWQKNNPGEINNLFNNERNIKYINNIYEKYFNKKIILDSELEKNTIIYSFDVTNDMFINNKCDNKVHMYTHTELDINKKLPANTRLKNYEYDYVKKDIKLESESNTYINKDNNWNFIKSEIEQYNILNKHDIIKKFYENSKYFAIFNKHIKRKIGIYFHCIERNYFIEFLKLADYSPDFIEFFVRYYNYTQNLSFEIAMDYDPIKQDFVRFAFYGSI